MVGSSSNGAGFAGYLARLRSALEGIDPRAVEALVQAVHEMYRRGRRLFIAGNGGSAATASHMACDLSKGIFLGNESARPGRFRVIALTDNVAVMTAWANDASYESVFAHQLRTLGEAGDLLIVISASGNSPSIVEVLRQAQQMGIGTVGLLGFGGGKAKDLVDLAVLVPSDEYGPVEDAHVVLDHFLTDRLRELLAGT